MGKKEDNMNNFMPINFKTYKIQKNSLKNTTLKMLQEEKIQIVLHLLRKLIKNLSRNSKDSMDKV